MTVDEITYVTMKNRLPKLVAVIVEENPLVTLIRKRTPPPTRWQQFKNRWLGHTYRARNAWLVLTGKAEVE